MGMDRLSNLPDSVIHHILSLMDAKYAVQTCVLSKKWKFHWAHIPCYRFDCSTSSNDVEFHDFFAFVLSDRKRFNLSRPTFRVGGITMWSLVIMFYSYVVFCRVEVLDVRKKVQIDDQMVVDRLSSLPDSIIHHILSLMETKYAVQTCVLSKRWRNHWTNVHSLNFVHPYAGRCFAFKGLVYHVLSRRKSFDLRKLKFICNMVRPQFFRTVFEYAISHRLEELETDVIGEFPQSHGCNTLKTLSLYQTIGGLKSVTTLLTLNVSNWVNLENLHLVEWDADSREVVISNVPRLVTLTVSDCRFCKKMTITAPRLRLLNWKGGSPCLLSFDKCLALDEVKFHMSPPVNFRAKKWFASMRDMIEGCCHAKSITVALKLNNSEGKLVLYYSSVDAETKVLELNKEIGEERLLFASPMVSGFDLISLPPY